VQLQSQLADFNARSISIVAITVDPVDKSQSLAHDSGLTFPLLSDPSFAVTRSYGAADEANGIPWPSEFLVDAPGVIRWRATAEAVGTRPSANDVLRAFDEAGK
jgi:peroxiredoxin Q/BCP